ncbi:MAG TPA: aminotransferase class I/II-fold pyridoxal phosphate-dependent enzyme [Candidatus Dormibacteraeota bacterium]|nr:aminotransferase class I/II-fold pyridoxal phosphate-dependent enzyme [Candidatus Dormibacteraeota bacterium]
MSAPRIPMLVPSLPGRARDYLVECVETNWVSSVGPFVGRFEREFAERTGAEHAVACASGTAALHLILLALGIGPGDEVLVSDLTFVASANPVRHCGAEVTLVDSETRTWNLDPALVLDELTRRRRSGGRLPAAIVAVDVLGQPADLAPLLSAATDMGIPVIEDAAEALGARWTAGALAGHHAGTPARAGFFSFNGNKIITTGGGGMVVTGDGHLAARVRHLSTQARVGPDFDHDEVAYNYRLVNVCAALGVAQLECLDDFLARKRAIAAAYDERFAAVEAVTPPPLVPGMERSGWLYTILLADRTMRDDVRAALAAHGIETRPLWTPLHLLRPYEGARVIGGGATAAALSARGLSLPSSVSLTDPELDEVADRILDRVRGRAVA